MKIKLLLTLGAVSLFNLASQAGTTSWSLTAPTIDGADIANFTGASSEAGNIGGVGGDDNYLAANRPAQGQTFLTGSASNGYTLKAVTLQHVPFSLGYSDNYTYGTATIRIGIISSGVFTALNSETFAITGANGFISDGGGEYVTYTFATPIALAANTTYAFDVASDGGYYEVNGTRLSNVYADGGAYISGANGAGNTIASARNYDRVFHLDMSVGVVSETIVNINGSVEGRTFEGIGAVSAGASTRLLVDYPSVQKSQVLDYLFKPNYGASFQHLKVEIGSDANSTDGTEPSFARTKSEFDNPTAAYFSRGYEYWLMKEAKARNGSIYLDCLEWGAPGWIGNIYSTNNINYLLAFIKGAKTYHNLDIDYVGIWNERPNYSSAGLNFVKDLRVALNNNNLPAVKIAGIDAINDWSIAANVNSDATLKAAIGAIAIHYPSGFGLNAANSMGFSYGNNTVAQNTGLPLYSSEDGPWTGTWDGAKAIARINNKNYINNKITKTEYWSPVSSYYDVLSIAGSGVMYANQPWSGHYDVQPAVWAVAHTTQFAQPGWKYIDSGCGLLGGGNGSYVTLKKPDGSGNYSIIAETTGFATSQTVTINLSNLSVGTVHVWKSDPTNQFIQQADITPSNGSFSITMEPQAIYSLTTTTGQSKGAAASPGSAPFPTSYSEDFEGYGVGVTPKYFADQVGAFEVYQAAGETKSLRQVMTNRPITWVNDAWPNTIVGDQNLTDYDVSTSALIEGTTGQVGLLGRVSAVPGYEQGIEPNGYGLYVHESGFWVLRKRGTTLATGTVPFSANTWHTLKFSFSGDNIRAYIDGAQIVNLNDSTYSSGLAGLATDWNIGRFDQFAIAAVNPNQASIMWSAGGGILSLSWPHHPGWILQHQSNSISVGLSNNWVDVPGSENIIVTNTSISGVVSAMFYRLRHP